MLIIFDLDDTLIDTSGSVTPFKMRQCLQRMIDDGSPVDNFDEAYAELLALNAEAPSSKDAINCFVDKRNYSRNKLSNVLAELTSPLPSDFSIPMTPQAAEVLTFLAQFHTVALVTGGNVRFQREKMEKAGLDSSIFSTISILEDSIKKPAYEVLIKNFSKSSGQVWVCGDRIEMDLLPAKELGARTIHMRWGRGKKKSVDWVDHSISLLSELKEIIV